MQLLGTIETTHINFQKAGLKLHMGVNNMDQKYNLLFSRFRYIKIDTLSEAVCFASLIQFSPLIFFVA